MSTFLPYLFAIPTYLGAILEIIFYICHLRHFGIRQISAKEGRLTLRKTAAPPLHMQGGARFYA